MFITELSLLKVPRPAVPSDPYRRSNSTVDLWESAGRQISPLWQLLALLQLHSLVIAPPLQTGVLRKLSPAFHSSAPHSERRTCLSCTMVPVVSQTSSDLQCTKLSRSIAVNSTRSCKDDIAYPLCILAASSPDPRGVQDDLSVFE